MNVVIIAVILALLLVYWKWGYMLNTHMVKTRSTRRAYRVVSAYSDHEQAAERMAELDQFARDFIGKLKSKYAGQSQGMGAVLTNNLLSRYNSDSLYENGGSGTSFTTNKGEKIALCLRQRVPPYQLHSIETLKYVFLHELTHVAMTGTDAKHSLNFWHCFKFILQEANSMGLYKPQNFKQNPQVYCGLKLQYNPFYDYR